jgi:hypothetical protein
MAKNRFLLGLGLVIFSVIFPFFGDCQEPLLNQSAIIVQRHERAIVPIFKMYIYIDDRLYQTSSRGILGKVKYTDYNIKLGETATIPINDGVHSIFVKAGTLESEKIAFTATQNITPFLITIEEGNLILTLR